MCKNVQDKVGRIYRKNSWLSGSKSFRLGRLYPPARLAMNLAAKRRHSNLTRSVRCSETAHCSWHYTNCWWLASAPNKVPATCTCDINFTLQPGVKQHSLMTQFVIMFKLFFCQGDWSATILMDGTLPSGEVGEFESLWMFGVCCGWMWPISNIFHCGLAR